MRSMLSVCVRACVRACVRVCVCVYSKEKVQPRPPSLLVLLIKELITGYSKIGSNSSSNSSIAKGE